MERTHKLVEEIIEPIKKKFNIEVEKNILFVLGSIIVGYFIFLGVSNLNSTYEYALKIILFSSFLLFIISFLSFLRYVLRAPKYIANYEEKLNKGFDGFYEKLSVDLKDLIKNYLVPSAMNKIAEKNISFENQDQLQSYLTDEMKDFFNKDNIGIRLKESYASEFFTDIDDITIDKKFVKFNFFLDELCEKVRYPTLVLGLLLIIVAWYIFLKL